MPIDVVICADTRHVVIRITDLAGGIPRHVGSQIWSSLGVRVIGSLGDPGLVVKLMICFLWMNFWSKKPGVVVQWEPCLRGSTNAKVWPI